MNSGTYVGLILILGLGTTQLSWGRQPAASVLGYQTVKFSVFKVSNDATLGYVTFSNSRSDVEVGRGIKVPDDMISNGEKFDTAECPCPGRVKLVFSEGSFRESYGALVFETENPAGAKLVCDPEKKEDIPEAGCPKDESGK